MIEFQNGTGRGGHGFGTSELHVCTSCIFNVFVIPGEGGGILHAQALGGFSIPLFGGFLKFEFPSSFSRL